jgi:hypothetical protein
MIVFENQEAFEEAVMDVIRDKLRVGVTVSKERKCYYGEDEYTKVSVGLLEAETGDVIDRGSDYA